MLTSIGTLLIIAGLVWMFAEISKVDSKDQSAERWKRDFIRELTFISHFHMSFDEISQSAAESSRMWMALGKDPCEAAYHEFESFKLARGIK